MGVILKFIIFILAGLFFLTIILGTRVMGAILRLLFGPKRSNPYQQRQQQQQHHNNEPESQEGRIISYQKKHFEANAEDVEFEEIKDEETK